MTQSRADRVIKYAAIVAPTIAVLTLLWAGVALPGEIQEVKAEAKALDERVDTLEKFLPVLSERMQRFEEAQKQMLDLLREELRRHHN